MGTENVGDILRNTLTAMANADNSVPDDYWDENGLLMCGNCHKPKQAWVDWLPDADGKREKKLVPIMCECAEQEWKRSEEQRKKQNFLKRLNDLRSAFGMNMPKYTFADDDNPDNVYSKACRKYVARWKAMQTDNMGILFYGNKGTGKTFYAACIANALADRGVTTAFTTTANIMAVLSSKDKVEAIDAISRVQLLVIDDLNAERDTSYGLELLYSMIDTRYRSRKPTIITTNLEYENMKEETNLALSRIFDRVIEMCPISMKIKGESRRNGIADDRKKKARALLIETMQEIAYGD